MRTFAIIKTIEKVMTSKAETTSTATSAGCKFAFIGKLKETTAKFLARPYVPTVLVVAFLSSFIYLVRADLIHLSAGATVKDVSDFSSRMKFVLRYQSINCAWLMFSVWMVCRRQKAGNAEMVAEARSHLSVTKEQLMLSFLSQLVLITWLDSGSVLHVIPSLNLLFILGRITYWLGYPTHKTIGAQITMFPTMAAIAYNLFQFGRVYKLY